MAPFFHWHEGAVLPLKNADRLKISLRKSRDYMP